jgi:hypothetical protein
MKTAPGRRPGAAPFRVSVCDLVAIAVAAAAAATVAAAATTAAAATVATAATTTTAAAEAATAATTTAATAAAILRFVHAQRATAEVATVEGLDRVVCVASLAHLHEGEPSRPTGLTVGDDAHLFDGTMALEELLDLAFGGTERKVPDVQLLTQSMILVAPAHARERDTRRNPGRTARPIDPVRRQPLAIAAARSRPRTSGKGD